MNTTCDLTCKTKYHKEAIRFYKDDILFESCIPLEGNIYCTSHYDRYELVYTKTRNEAVLRIRQLDILLDTGTWHCSYGNRTSEEKKLIVYSK